MITRVTGNLVRLTVEAAYVDIAAMEYEIFIPEFVRRQLQPLVGQQVSLRTIEYLEGNPQQGRLVPRMVGFRHDIEREFFELVCSVDGVGVKKALRAMVRPVREVAAAIEEKDIKQLSTLPGVGPAVAERIVAKLRRKMARFALMIAEETGEQEKGATDIFAEAHEALLALGHPASEARSRIEDVLESGRKCKSVEDVLSEIYRRQSQ